MSRTSRCVSNAKRRRRRSKCAPDSSRVAFVWKPAPRRSRCKGKKRTRASRNAEASSEGDGFTLGAIRRATLLRHDIVEQRVSRVADVIVVMTDERECVVVPGDDVG